ncbi:endonuclease/exonuclease/phosphatase family protein [Nocardioides euryhalodurans]|uniref:Endonuclease/exonuclease/phosphatase domain-containing protein n=1 Tax=Nocardioides euryhalodurans TaxID=2518370 RepID=A0A4P7GJ95_9ACTN|nr:endonuclease/exonuclease/phosphatase family protein [Nocardioides euryhalodurans]QBR91953.1 hypothetical protein EXE57_06425 [Nocardioides euryhalodurans]
MRGRRIDVLLTVALVVVLVGAGLGIAFLGTAPAPDVVAPEPETPASTAPSSPTATTPPPATPTGRSRPPRPTRPPVMPSATASVCPELTAEGSVLRVLSYNVHSGRGVDGRLDVARIAGLLRQWDVDVALLQEVDRGRRASRYVDMPAILARQTGMDLAYGVNWRPNGGEYGVATLSRFPIVEQRNTLLPNAPGYQQRGLLRADIDVAGTTISTYNTHLENKSQLMRLRQVSASRRIVAQTRHPVILGGDLNSQPGSPMLGVLRSFVSDAWDVAGRGPGLTVPLRNPRLRVDYVMYSPPLEATSAQVLSSSASNHRAVLADLVLPGDSTAICVPDLTGPVPGNGPDRGRSGPAR